MKKVSKVFVGFTVALIAFVFTVRIIQGCIVDDKESHHLTEPSPTIRKYYSLCYILAQRYTINRLILGNNYQEDRFHQITPKDTLNTKNIKTSTSNK